ncbi:unnamed protein product [Adineta steineri]|uniref:G-protein coupled receptors family 1 profile domain-containing protein n=1 Tax=Adineta steineri TaxID=433720 RepID=A0A815WYX0_9BILA|nr:unnamed protein product [Adineta steineri]CAF1553999.1 unnamed protein product [Adineta steineri]
MFSFGTVGHILTSATAGLIVVYTLVPLRLLQYVYKIDAFASSDAMCRILSWTLPSWFIVLACADRVLCSSSSATIRAWSNIRVVTRATPLTLLIVGLAYVHVPFYNRLNTTSSCVGTSGTYATFVGIFNLFIFGMGPPVCMLTFGLLAIRNVRQSVKRMAPNNIPTGTQNQLQHRQKATDRQLMQMMIVQSMFFILTGTPSSFVYFYSLAISNEVLNALQTARLSLVVIVTAFLTNGGASDGPEIYLYPTSMFVPLGTPISYYHVVRETLKYQCL